MKTLSGWKPALAFALLSLPLTQSFATMKRSDNSSWYDEWWDDIVDDFDKATELIEGAIVKEVSSIVASMQPAGVIAQKTFGYTETPPISTSLKKSSLNSGVTVGLYDDSGDYSQPEAFVPFKSNFSGWDDAWFGIALDSFDVVLEADVILAGSASGEYTLSLLKIPVAYDGVGVEVDFQLYMTAEAAAAITFTAGLELKLKNPAAIMAPVFNPILQLNESQVFGFDMDNFELKPIFNASMPQIDISAMLALRTIFSVTVEGVDVGALTLDLPAFDFGINTLQNKMSNCKAPHPDTPPDQIYAELISITGSLDAILSYEALNDEFSGVIHKWTIWDVIDDCYAFLPGSGSIGKVPPKSDDALLSEKPVATCTTEGKTTTGVMATMSLSRGEKAAVAIGALIGVSLIAALAFFAGRASQRRNDRKHGMQSMDDGSHSAMGGLLHRKELVDATRNTLFHVVPVRQMDDGSSLLPSAGTEVQDSESRQIWPRRKPIPPVITVEDADLSPSSESASRQSDGPPTDRRDEPGNASNEGDSGPGKYWGPGDIQVEGYQPMTNGRWSRVQQKRY